MELSMLDPELTDVNGPFWEGIASRQLRLPRCSRCGAFQWYPDSTGPDCAGAEYDWAPSAGRGTVHTMTRVHRQFLPGGGDGAPFVVGFVELDDAPGIRLVAQLDDVPGLAIGSRVEAAFVAVEGGQRMIFRQAGRASADPVAAGDQVPESLARYLASVGTGDIDTAAAVFADDGVHASCPTDGNEIAPRRVVIGRDGIRARLDDVDHTVDHRVILCVSDGRRCYVEGVRFGKQTDSPAGSFVASAWFDEAGLIVRYLEYDCPETVLPSPADVAESTNTTAAAATSTTATDVSHDALAAVDRYFTALDTSDFRGAADTFSEDVLYSHPPYTGQPDLPSSRRVDFNGRSQLYDESFSRRAPHTLVHRVLDGIQRGPHCIVEGIVEGLPDGDTVSFISSLTLDAEGLIRRYASWCSRPSVPQVDR